MSPPSGATMSPPSGVAMSPKPLTEPPSEPRIPINISAPTSVDVEKGDFRRGSKLKGVHTIESAKTDTSECYRLARENYGERWTALVTKALRASDAQDVLAEIKNAIEDGEDLGYVLWRPD